jgi:hypothetical protein
MVGKHATKLAVLLPSGYDHVIYWIEIEINTYN